MAGFLPGGLLAPQQQGGGIFGSYGQQAGGIFAALKDFADSARGVGSADNFANYQAQNQQSQMRQQLLQGLNSEDPAERQQAYGYANLLGIPTDGFQKQQAAAALPKLLQSMQPKQENVAALQLDNGAATPAFDYQTPGMGLSDALANSGSPELQAQYAPELIKQQMEANAPFNLSAGQHRFFNGQEIASLPDKPENLPDSVQIAQTLFPNDPAKQREYLLKNQPSSLRAISNYNAPKENWQVLTDPKNNTQYRYEVNSGRAFTFDNKPYTPQGAAKISGGSPRSPAMVYMGKFMEEHPNATVDQIQTAANKFRSGQSEAGTIGTRAGAADVASQEVSVFAKQALDATRALPRSDYAALNNVLQNWDMKTSNPQLRRLMIAADALVNARARAISPTGSPHVNDQLEGRKMLAAAFANGDFEAAVDQISMEAEGVRSSTKASKDEFFGNKPPAALPRLQTKPKTVRFEDLP